MLLHAHDVAGRLRFVSPVQLLRLAARAAISALL
jgi:hypothetical protein